MDNIHATPVEQAPPTPAEEQVFGDSMAANYETSQVEAPISIYKQVNGAPYTVEFFDADYPDEPEFADYRLQLDEIEDYMSTLIERRALTDTKESYKQLMQEIYEQLQIQDNETPRNKIEKVHTFIKMALRARAIEDKEKKLKEMIYGKTEL